VTHHRNGVLWEATLRHFCQPGRTPKKKKETFLVDNTKQTRSARNLHKSSSGETRRRLNTLQKNRRLCRRPAAGSEGKKEWSGLRVKGLGKDEGLKRNRPKGKGTLRKGFIPTKFAFPQTDSQNGRLFFLATAPGDCVHIYKGVSRETPITRKRPPK